MSDTELEKLYQNLDLTFAMQQIADRLEELGDHKRALIWRWIAKKQLFPSKRGRWYYWVNSKTASKTAPNRLDWRVGKVYIPQPRKSMFWDTCWHDIDLSWKRSESVVEAYQSLVSIILATFDRAHADVQTLKIDIFSDLFCEYLLLSR